MNTRLVEVAAWEGHAETETIQLAERLAKWAEPGTVLALDGDLGAGKTRFSQAFAAALGVPGIVNSPTFTIIKEYEGQKLPFYHMDVYRLSIEEADDLGLDDYFFGEGVTIVEWASLIEELLPPDRLHVQLVHLGGQSRRYELMGIGGRYAELVKGLAYEQRGQREEGQA
ncbi:tRNA threonylcarbamoyladenosine biosynthesis protein TsaE [Paenibacillus cellulosilyticus]|uniref:tRNA threonylcarbamoyladenosine biosynthesis protein TsaE n=1 Tax=Paenibacillus cellulosilyticus TaxID=375489 RepID=A0A2V2YKH5_9BACL|nr:tRNA (adenosine(37)-N6)-threonylcarbamoyltransferase complex ATPase subunit type 1 TsaE [Paenibacillus cellulosilyticus]PWV93772.1 tRNA threonylcarbamoyladenosine biosynthesis protein TsaE [Paenibacillus cellulosilyticus]QKS47394.1 tRNA (adenosine(37)-N6)-threonylcarbamoyltransferase complex ATPase subunit type 1 TsaE [Paenibacillus cellulosilyticus]